MDIKFELQFKKKPSVTTGLKTFWGAESFLTTVIIYRA